MNRLMRYFSRQPRADKRDRPIKRQAPMPSGGTPEVGGYFAGYASGGYEQRNPPEPPP